MEGLSPGGAVRRPGRPLVLGTVEIITPPSLMLLARITLQVVKPVVQSVQPAKQTPWIVEPVKPVDPVTPVTPIQPLEPLYTP